MTCLARPSVSKTKTNKAKIDVNFFQDNTNRYAKMSEIVYSCSHSVLVYNDVELLRDGVLLQSRMSLTSNTFYFTDIANTTFR